MRLAWTAAFILGMGALAFARADGDDEKKSPKPAEVDPNDRINRLEKEIEQLKAEGLSILLIDKDVAALARVADRHYVLEKGRVVWSGSSAELGANPEVQHRYLGV